MKPKVALVRYTSDKKRDVVSVHEIGEFHPKTVNDFDGKKVYQVRCSVVRRSESDQHDEHYSEPYPAKILLLAATDKSMLVAARTKREKLPPGYAERVKREVKEQNNSPENLQKRKSTKEIKRAVRQSDQERMKDIITTNLQDRKKTEDHANVATGGNVPVDELNQESPSVNSVILVSESKEENLLVKANVSVGQFNQENQSDSTLNAMNPADTGPKIDVISSSLKQVKCVEEPITVNLEAKTNSSGSSLLMESSPPKNQEIVDHKHSPDSIGDNADGLPSMSNGSESQFISSHPYSSGIRTNRKLTFDSNFQPRDLFDSKKASSKSEEDTTETESATCSYQSSTSLIKELESKNVSLQLSNQSLKKRNRMLTKCLKSALNIMLQESEEIQNILHLHGDQGDEEAPTRSTSKSWTVMPSPVKNSTSKFKTPSKILRSLPSDLSPIGTPKEKTSHSERRKSDIQDNISPKKSKLVAVDCSGNSKLIQSPDSLLRAHSFERTPLKNSEKQNGLLSPGSSKKGVKRSPSKSPQSSKKSETSSKSNKTKKKSKLENTLEHGEVKADVLSNDLLKVLKKERDIQMNENRSKVCIGNNTWIKKGVWRDKFSKTSKNLKRLVSELAEEVWGTVGCGNLSLTGGVSPKTPGAAQKAPAPAGKVEAIFGLCRAHLMWQGMTNPDHLNQSLTQCRLYLRDMFNESARKLKREEKKKKQSKQDED